MPKTTADTSAGSLPRILHRKPFLGTSSWSTKDWEGTVYPRGCPPGDYLAQYAKRYRTVEVDSSFYRSPSATMTKRWREVLPDGFVMVVKVPQTITHEKVLQDCDVEVKEFLAAMDPLGDRLGPLLLQFPYFNKASGMTLPAFLDRLRSFLSCVPFGYRFALEVRNKGWLRPELTGLLARHRIALALIDHPWMPRIDMFLAQLDPVTTDFCYIRWLGDRKGIDAQTKTWDRIIIDRSRETRAWVTTVRGLLGRGVTVYGCINNHYAGNAPGSIELLESTWDEMGPTA